MANEDPVNQILLMDRSPAIGNSPDTFGRRAAHVKIGNKPNEPIPVDVSGVGGFGTLSFGPTQVNVSTTSAVILPANPDRKYAHFVNNSNQYVFLQYGAPAVVGQGIRLPPGGSRLRVSGDELWLGDVSAITATGTVALDVMEATT